MAHAFASNRVVTPQGIRRAVLLLEDSPAGLIRAICDLGDLPADAHLVDFGERALLPGLVDSHVHINEPGRTEWEGFAAKPEQFFDAGETIIVTGRYSGVYRATGKSIDAQFAHLWTVEAGKALRFQQYTDTLQADRVTQKSAGA